MEWRGLRWRASLTDTALVFQTRAGKVVNLPLVSASRLEVDVRLLGARICLEGESLLRIWWGRRSLIDAVLWHSAAQPLLEWSLRVEQVLENYRVEQRWLPEEIVEELAAARPPQAAIDTAKVASTRLPIDSLRNAVLNASGTRLVERVREQNENTVRAELRDRRNLFDTIESAPLTDEQARAVVTMDNRVLVVASAGSGKTSVIVARAAYAIARGFMQPDEVLMLAFNRAAADELKTRLQERLGRSDIDASGVRVETVHAFGLSLLGTKRGRPSIPTWLSGENGYSRIAEIVRDLRAASEDFDRQWETFRILLIDSPSLKSREEFLEQARETPELHRTLGAERFVRSYGERLIADWLYLHGIEYVYERAYPHPVSGPEKVQYRPDFFYPQAGLWHEHWALDGDGNPPDDRSFSGYLEQIEWKRSVHRRHKTPLIESTFAQVVFGNGLEQLRTALAEHGVAAIYDPARAKRAQDAAAEKQLLLLLRTFMTHVKSGDLSAQDLTSRLEGRWKSINTHAMREFLKIFWPIYEEWGQRLRDKNEIDFEDMLLQSSRVLADDPGLLPYRLILIDEFQDSSLARAKLFKALLGAPGRFLMAVGDDWQAINRFAGADISVMTEFRELFGRCTRVDLSTTFRSPRPLAELAATLVMRNPRQLKKDVRSVVAHPGRLEVVKTRNAAASLAAALDRIAAVERSDQTSDGAHVFVLGRYNFDRDLMPRALPEELTVEFSTVHRAKGLEADYVVLPQMSAGKYGFPSQVQDSPLLELALSEPDAHPHGEERRLFYVALTRARRGVTLIAREEDPSPFFTEVLTEMPNCEVRVERSVAPRRDKGEKSDNPITDTHASAYPPHIMLPVEDMLAFVRQAMNNPKIELKFTRHYIGLQPYALTRHFITWQRKSEALLISIRLPFDSKLQTALGGMALGQVEYDLTLRKWRILMDVGAYPDHREALGLMIAAAARLIDHAG